MAIFNSKLLVYQRVHRKKKHRNGNDRRENGDSPTNSRGPFWSKKPSLSKIRLLVEPSGKRKRQSPEFQWTYVPMIVPPMSTLGLFLPC